MVNLRFFTALKFKLFGRKYKVVRFSDNASSVEIVEGIQLLPEGILKDHWLNKAYEIPQGTNPITIIANNKPEIGYAVSSRGVAISIKENVVLREPDHYDETGKWIQYEEGERPAIEGNFDGLLGELTSINMIGQGFDLSPSLREKAMFAIGGILVGLVLSPVLGAAF